MQTSERVNSVRLMRSVPEVEAKMNSGNLSMSTASQVHRFLRQEKKVGHSVSEAETLKIVESCEGKSKREVEKALFSMASEEVHASAERTKVVSDCLTEVKFLIPESTFKKLEEVKNLIGNDSLKDIFDRALDALLNQNKKKKGMVSETTFPGKESIKTRLNPFPGTPNDPTPLQIRKRFIPIAIKRIVSQRSGNQCEFVDLKTNKRCDSKHKLQFDHFPLPFAFGGTHTSANLRHACFQHNQKGAILQTGLHPNPDSTN
jgi:hypothetical protein